MAPDLVEYFVIVVSGETAVASIAPELVQLLTNTSIRLLDVVLVIVDADGSATVVEVDSVEGLGELALIEKPFGAWLSKHDIDLITMSLQPGTTGVVVVAEDRWAEQVARAAHAVGGEIRSGERIARARVEAALADANERGGSR